MKKQTGRINAQLCGGKTEFDVDLEILMQRYGSLVGCEPEPGVTEEEIKQRLSEAYRAGPTCHNPKIQPHEEAFAQSARVTGQELGWDERRTEEYVLDRIMVRRRNDLIRQRVRMQEVLPLAEVIENNRADRASGGKATEKLTTDSEILLLKSTYAQYRSYSKTAKELRSRHGIDVSAKTVGRKVKKLGI